MKKSTIRILVVSLLLILIGFCLFFGGLASAGGMQAVERVLEEHEIEFLDELDIDLHEGEFDIDINSGRVRIDMDF